MITCIKCNKEFSTYKIIDGKPRNLCRRKRCLECQPWKAPRYPPRTIDESLIASRDSSKKYYLKMKDKLGVDPHRYRTRQRKEALVKILGGCVFCKYNKVSRAIAFHHCFDKESSLESSNLTKSIKDVLFEISKCIMVCHNCHCEIHDGVLDDKPKFEEFQKKVEVLKLCSSWNEVLALVDKGPVIQR